MTSQRRPDHVWVQEVPERFAFRYEGGRGYVDDVPLDAIADAVGTPQQVRRVIDGVRANDIPVVFCESTVNTDPAKQVARETGAAYGGELYVDSLSEADGPVPTYLDLLRVTAGTVADGLAPAGE